jgi:hypothetical protein
MDCIQAQAVISEALDRSPVDSGVLEAAKVHCRECEQCAAYVRALNAVGRAPLPEPPADLADRIMATIRAEAAAVEQSEPELGETATLAAALEDTLAALDEETAEPLEPKRPRATVISLEPLDAADAGRETEPPAEMTDAQPAPEIDEAVSQESHPAVAAAAARLSVGRSRRAVLAWGSAAAVLLVLIGVGGALGIMKLVDSGSTRSATSDTALTTAPEAAAPTTAPDRGATLGSGAEGGAATKAVPSVSADLSSRLWLVFSTQAYLQSGGASSVQKSQLRVIGQTSITFEPGAAAKLRPVMAGSDPGVVYAENDAGELQRFVEVTRVYKDTVYRLQSAQIAAYGDWPALPPGIPRPVPEDAANGAPAFALDGNDTTGTPVYHRVGSDRRSGIAIPPNTPSPDPAAGNPNWTWWAP